MLSFSYSPEPYLKIYNGSLTVAFASTAYNVTLGAWQFLAATFNGTNARVYLNGQLKASSYQSFYSLSTINRTKCYIGYIDPNFNSFSHLDDLRIYNKSLTQTEILELMSQNDTSKLR